MAKRTLDVLSALLETIEGASDERITRIERAVAIEKALKALSVDERLNKIAAMRHTVERDQVDEAATIYELTADYDKRMADLWLSPVIQDQWAMVMAKVGGKPKGEAAMDALIHKHVAFRTLALYLDNTALVYAELATKVNAIRKAHQEERGKTRKLMAGLRVTVERDQVRARKLTDELRAMALTPGEQAEVKAVFAPPKVTKKVKVVVDTVTLAKRMVVAAGDEVKAILADHGYTVGDENLVIAESAGAPLVIASLTIGGATVPMKVRVEGEWQKDLARRLAQYS